MQPVQEVQAHRVDGEHVHRKVDTLGRARRRVVVAVAAKYRDPSFREEFQGRWMQPGARIRGVPRPERPAAAAVADPDEEQIARFDADLLRRFRGDQVIGGHVITGLQPRHPPHPRDVEQQTTADDPAAGHLDGQLSGPRRGDGARAQAVVEGPVEDHVTQGVDVAVGVAVDVHGYPVHGEGESGGGTRAGPGVSHLVHGGIGVVGRHLALDRRRQRHSAATPDIAGRRHDLRGRDVVQCSPPVGWSPPGHVLHPVVKGPELGRAQLKVAHLARAYPARLEGPVPVAEASACTGELGTGRATRKRSASGREAARRTHCVPVPPARWCTSVPGARHGQRRATSSPARRGGCGSRSGSRCG